MLQHAWAELAHDRNYKFSGKLPPEIERKLYLYAGMLEIADRGFDELSLQIEKYIRSLDEKSSKGDLSSELNSISLTQFVEVWSKENELLLNEGQRDIDGELVEELRQFGVTTLAELSSIIPKNFVRIVKAKKYMTTIHGLVRDWMLITDWRRFLKDVTFNWVVERPDNILEAFFDDTELEEFFRSFEWV